MTGPHVPDNAELLAVDPDVARWLRREADDYFRGDVSSALNHHLSLAKARQDYWRSLPADENGDPPHDPWERLTATLPPLPAPRQGFTCPVCTRTSYHPKDLAEGYCGACKTFTGEKAT